MYKPVNLTGVVHGPSGDMASGPRCQGPLSSSFFIKYFYQHLSVSELSGSKSWDDLITFSILMHISVL